MYLLLFLHLCVFAWGVGCGVWMSWSAWIHVCACFMVWCLSLDEMILRILENCTGYKFTSNTWALQVWSSCMLSLLQVQLLWSSYKRTWNDSSVQREIILRKSLKNTCNRTRNWWLIPSGSSMLLILKPLCPECVRWSVFSVAYHFCCFQYLASVLCNP